MKAARRMRHAEAGVTLVETLVALFVIALMATAGAVMTNQSLRGARAVETRGAAAAELSTALSLISADLAAYADRSSQDASGAEPPNAFEGYAPRHDGRLMIFVRNGWENPAGDVRGDLQRVEYLFRDGALIRRSWQAPDPGPNTDFVDQTLLSGIQKIDAQFGRADEWQSEWGAAISASRAAPQKVELKISFSPDDIITARYLIGAGT